MFNRLDMQFLWRTGVAARDEFLVLRQLRHRLSFSSLLPLPLRSVA